MAEQQNRRRLSLHTWTGWALVVGLAAVGAGISAAFAPSTSLLWRIGPAAVGGTATLVAVYLAERGHQRSEAKATALSARGEVLDALVADPASEGSVLDVLLATSTKAAPFRGRKDELAGLEWWWDDPEQPPVAVVTGPAGTGKTRLVTAFAESRPAPWVRGWLSAGRGDNAVAAIAACDDPALILVDEADQRADVAALLASLSADRGTGPAVRVILVSRAGGLLGRLAPTLDDRSRGVLDGIHELPLGPFGGADDRARWFGEAVKAYAQARRVPPPDLPVHLSSYVTDPNEPILTLHAQALLAVLDSEGSRPMRPRAEDLPFDRVAAALFAHEQHRWQTSARRPEFGLTDLTSLVQQHAIVALLLASPADQAQAVAVLRRVPELAQASAERLANIAVWAAHLYPGDPWWPIRIKPDMLAERFVVTQLIETPELASLLQEMTLAQETALLVLLAHASDHISQAVKLFASLIATDVTRLAEVGIAAALSASTGQWRLDAELASLIGQVTWSVESLDRVEDQLTGRLPRTWAAIAEVRVAIARDEGDALRLAAALSNLGTFLGELGRDREALPATEEAVDLWRTLARDNPDYQPTLATALQNLGSRLRRLGRYEEALAATEEAVDLWRTLARDNPACQADLAMALGALAVHLSELGRYHEVLAAAGEAVDLWRALAHDNPDRRPGLAMAVDTLAGASGELGRSEEALPITEEAIDLWRALARDNPAHEPSLAIALENLAIHLSRLGRGREALAPAGEAVDLWRALARHNPAHQPGLARALGVLGTSMHALGRYQEALRITREEVGLWRALVRDNPAYGRSLAVALGNLATHLDRLGDTEKALATTEEAVSFWRGLARDNPSYQRSLANGLGNLGAHLGELGRSEEALPITEEAVDLWRALARDNPARQADLATALGNLRIHLRRLGRSEEALAAAEEAVGLWRGLAESYPGQYQDTYNREQAKLRRDLSLHGQETASIWRNLSNDSPDRDERQSIPPTPDMPDR